MLKPSVEIFENSDGNSYYLFNVKDEDVMFSIPLNTEEFMILDSCLEAILYQDVEDISLDVCYAKIDKVRNMVLLRFTNYSPIMSFSIQKTEVINVLHKIKTILRT